MESKKINQLATELTPALSDLTIIGDPTTGISKKITLSQMASLFTGTVEEYASVSAFPLVGVADTIYIALDTNVLYRWDTTLTSYVELSPNIINSLVFSDANGFDGTISLVGSTATLTITTALTTGSVAFIGASGALTQDNDNFYWDNSNKRLGIGTKLPTTAIDAFGSGIIGRLNGTSTNNSFLGFASGGTNQWSIGNVQSDHRFRIYSEANTAELVSVLQTGEFGIGIANPTTKLHIDGGASALIANLDANVSVAKSISFRSDNSNRFNIEVSGIESGSNAGADFFIRRYSDAGALIDTPLTITRQTGTLTYSGIINISNATASSSITTGALVITGGIGISGALYGTTGVYSGLLNTTAGNGISAGGNSFAVLPSSTRGVININGSTDQFLTLGSNGYLQGSSTLVRLQSTPNLDFVVGGSQRLIINASNGLSTFNNDVNTIAGAGLLIGGGGYAIGPSSTRGIIALNGSGDQILTFSSQSYLYNSSSLFRMLSTSDIDFVSGGTQRLLISASNGAAKFSNSIAGGAVYSLSGFVNQTLTITTAALVYSLDKDQGASGGSSSTTFNITGIANEDGAFAIIRARSSNSGPFNVGITIQIHGNTVFSTSTQNVTKTATFMVFRQNGSWVTSSVGTGGTLSYP